VRWRRTPEDPPRLAVLQLALAQASADLLAPGGALLYCTCTVTRAENEGVVEALLASRPELSLEWGASSDEAVGPKAARARVGGDGFFRTLPPRDHCDAFFAARLVKAGPR
jgi:16S rRNA (cytosine967-C5)-methyltransferase